MRNTADAHLDRVVEAIQNYLSRHPGAADSELGVAQWWLHDWLQGSGESVTAEDVRRALEWLQQRGEVEALDVAGADRLWRAATGQSGNADGD